MNAQGAGFGVGAGGDNKMSTRISACGGQQNNQGIPFGNEPMNIPFRTLEYLSCKPLMASTFYKKFRNASGEGWNMDIMVQRI